MNQVFAFRVTVPQKPNWGATINAHTRGQAKREYLRDLHESWPDVPYTALRCQKVGGPETSERFTHNATYRGMPQVRCGQRVKVGDATGTIVGHNASANFDVLFDADSPKYPGMRLNCHPSSVELL